MRLIPYIRVSTDDQAQHGHSLATQEPALLRYAAAEGHALTGLVADEGVSAGKPLTRRAGGRALLAMLREGRADGVLVTRIDRLFRDSLDGLRFLEEAAAKGWRVVSTTEHIDTTTPAGRLQLNILLATAQYEREMASVRTTAVSKSLRERGKVYGVVPFGCKSIDGALVRDPRTWGIRQMICEWHTGARESLRTIRMRLHDRRIESPTGKRWWSTSTLANLIDTHGSLSHLPLLQPAADVPLSPEPSVSHESKSGHNPDDEEH